ncbi:MAG: DUF1643 domain-containing protein [Pseudomonadota bacterium]
MVDIPTKAIFNEATFSSCKKYRYILARTFATGTGIINFIMLNPSTATEQYNDPTVARCENRSISMGYKQMIVTNIFAYRATDPKLLLKISDPIGADNDKAIIDSAQKSNKIICAWGEYGKLLNRGDHVRQLLKLNSNNNIYCLKLNKSGEPAHPLYLSNKLVAKEYI